MTVVAIKAPVITRSCLPPILIVPGYTFVATPKTLIGTWHDEYNMSLGRCHKSGTGNNKGRRRTTPRDNRGLNRNGCHSKSNDMSLPVISVSLPLNNLVINPPQQS